GDQRLQRPVDLHAGRRAAQRLGLVDAELQHVPRLSGRAGDRADHV
ncbi:MAG: hypothetical protein AVDCRST_MAG64-2738, partial [uncultured Phycisphaerae bacterium]